MVARVMQERKTVMGFKLSVRLQGTQQIRKNNFSLYQDPRKNSDSFLQQPVINTVCTVHGVHKRILKNDVTRTETFPKPFWSEWWLLAFSDKENSKASFRCDAEQFPGPTHSLTMSLSHLQVSKQVWCKCLLRCSHPSQLCPTSYMTQGKTLNFHTSMASSSVKWE